MQPRSNGKHPSSLNRFFLLSQPFGYHFRRKPFKRPHETFRYRRKAFALRTILKALLAQLKALRATRIDLIAGHNISRALVGGQISPTINPVWAKKRAQQSRHLTCLNFQPKVVVG
jgi:hypothetical protein